MRDLPLRVSRWSAAHPWTAIAGWFGFVVACLVLSIAIGGNPATSADYRIGEAGRAEAMAAEGGLEQRPVERVLITAKDGSLDGAEAAARDVIARMRAIPEVAGTGEPVWSADGRALRVDITMAGPELEGKQHVDALIAQTEAVQAAYPALVVEETGGPSISKGVEALRGEDLRRTEIIALPVTLVTLLLVFASIAMALVPLLLALTSIAAAIGLSTMASHVFPDAGVGTNVILLIGLAVGVDYTLFYLKREREERAKAGGSLGSRELVNLASATSGRAVVTSGMAVIVSSATLYLADDVIFSSIATGAIVVTVAAVLSSLTVLPALLVKLGARAERRKRGAAPKRAGGRFTGAVLRPVAKRPGIALLVAVVGLVALSAPLLALNLTDMGRETHSRQIPAMRAFDRLNAAFPELKATHQIVVRADASREGEVADALRDLVALTAKDSRFAGAAPLRVSADHRITVLELSVPYYGGEPEATSSLDVLRDEYVPGTVGSLPGVDSAVSGDVARYTDYPVHQKERLPLIIGALLLVTFAMTAWAFRSIVLGIAGMVLNLLSAGASLGVLVMVFQGRWAEGPLGFESTGSIGSRVPLFLFVILFGLSMDYQVFVISRIREARLAGTSTRTAVLDGLRGSAGVVTSAAVVMVTVFASFAALHLIEMKQIGFSLAVAVLLDAFVIRLIVLPALMLLLGEANWWPSRPARPSVG